MAEFSKPDNINNVWASAGDKIYPGDAKTNLGWEVEIPPRQYFNNLDYKQDQAIAHINQHGIAVWDAVTEYQQDKSYAQGSDGIIYRAKLTGIGQNPVSSPDYWGVAFVTLNDANAARLYVGYELRTTDFTAQINKRYYFTSPLVMTLPATAGIGDVVTVYKSPNIQTTINVSTGVITTNLGTDTSVSYDYADEINFVYGNSGWEV